MTTHRSLNKLEFKAHMSIHNFTDVKEGESHLSRNYTRDRFGREHALSNENDTPRLRLRRGKKVLLLAFLFLSSAALAHAGETGSGSVGRGPNTVVESEPSDDRWLGRKLNQEPEEGSFGLAIDGDKTVGFNEDGDPSMSMRF